MDRSSKLTDAYCCIHFSTFEGHTSICRKTLNPIWDQDFRFDIAQDSVLQNHPIEFKIMDHDVYTSDTSIGMVYIDLKSLLIRATLQQQQPPQDQNNSKNNNTIEGWFPIYDTLEGVRGEIYLIIRLSYFGNFGSNLTHSSTGVPFFSVSTLDPSLYSTSPRMIGFVEELVVHADPEYDWSDSFRTSRKSNQYRQLLLYQLASQVASLVGKKTLEIGGNAVLGYQQHFDVEGDSGIVARASGTACWIEKNDPVLDTSDLAEVLVGGDLVMSSSTTGVVSGTQESTDLAPASPHKNASPKSNNSHRNVLATSSSRRKRRIRGGSFDHPRGCYINDEIQLVTLKDFSSSCSSYRMKLGGVVTCHSVKFLGKLATKLADQETRDSWWVEMREEIRAHAHALQCTHVMGYSESCTIFNDVCILSAAGTAAVVRQQESPSSTDSHLMIHKVRARKAGWGLKSGKSSNCSTCHIPYHRVQAPFARMRIVRCGLCGRKWVPEMLLATIDPPRGIVLRGEGALIQARICRPLYLATTASSEANATIVSDVLPFLDYELYRQLVVKMKVMGMNAIFRLETQLQMSASAIVSIVTGNVFYVNER